LIATIVLIGEIKPDMHIIGKNGSKSEDTDENSEMGYSQANKSAINETNTMDAVALAKQQKKDRKTALKRANRSLFTWLAKDLKYTFGMTNVRITIASIAQTAAIILTTNYIVSGITTPAVLHTNGGAFFGQVVLIWYFIHYLMIKVTFESDLAWRATSGVAYVFVPVIARAFAQQAIYEFHWNNDAENMWSKPTAYVNQDGIIMIACGFTAASGLVLVGVLIERLKLSRNTLDVMLLNSQMTVKKLEEEDKEAKKERLEAAQQCEQMKRMAELLVSCRPLFREYAFAFATAPGMQSVTSDKNNSKGKDTKDINAYVDTLLNNNNRNPIVNSNTSGINTDGDAFPFALFSLNSNIAQLGNNSINNSRITMFDSKNELHMLQLFEDVAAAMNRDTTIELKGLIGFTSATPEISASGNEPTTPINATRSVNQNNDQNININSNRIGRTLNDIPLIDILTQPVCFDIFRDKMSRINSDICDRPTELITLWLDIQYYRMLTDVFVRRTIANAIFDTYFTSQSPLYIPSLQKFQADIQRNVYTAPSTLYDTVELFIMDELSDAYTNFQSSIDYKFCALLLGHPLLIHSRFRELLRINGDGVRNQTAFSTNFAEMIRRIRNSPYLNSR
jgi:hypothetical protein